MIVWLRNPRARVDEPAVDSLGESVERIHLAPFLRCVFATFGYFAALGILIPLLPRYVEAEIGEGALSVGVVVGAFSLASVVSRPLVGVGGDYGWRRPLILMGGGLMALSILSYSVAASPLLLTGLRVATGMGGAAFFVGVATLAYMQVPRSRMGEAASYFSLALYSGYALGPVLGEYLVAGHGFEVGWLAAALLSFTSTFLVLGLPDMSADMRGRTARNGMTLFPRETFRPGAALACSAWGLAALMAFLPLYALQKGVARPGWLFALYSIVILLIRSVGARIPDHYGHVLTARAALTCSMFGLLGVASSAGAWLLSGSIALFAVGQALAFPSMMAMVMRSASDDNRGVLVGGFTAFFEGAVGVGALCSGLVARLVGYSGVFVVAALVAAAGLMVPLRYSITPVEHRQP